MNIEAMADELNNSLFNLIEGIDGFPVKGSRLSNMCEGWISQILADATGIDPYTVILYFDEGIPITSSRKSIKSSAERHNLPTLNFIRAFVKKLNDHCKEEFGDADPEFTRKYGPLYQFKVRETGRMSNDGWGNEYPEYMIYDDQGSLDWFEDEFLPKWIDEELGKSGFYAEPVGSSRFVIAVE